MTSCVKFATNPLVDDPGTEQCKAREVTEQYKADAFK